MYCTNKKGYSHLWLDRIDKACCVVKHIMKKHIKRNFKNSKIYMRSFFGVQVQKIDSRLRMWLSAIAETILAFLIALSDYSKNTLINELQYSCVL